MDLLSRCAMLEMEICYTNCSSKDQLRENNPELHQWLKALKFGIPALLITTSYVSIGARLCRKTQIGESFGQQQAREARKRTQVTMLREGVPSEKYHFLVKSLLGPSKINTGRLISSILSLSLDITNLCHCI